MPSKNPKQKKTMRAAARHRESAPKAATRSKDKPFPTMGKPSSSQNRKREP